MSAMTDEGVEQVKLSAADVLLEQRVEKKLASKVSSHMVNRIHVAVPVARDNKDRKPFIPKSVTEKGPAPTPLTKQERAIKQLEDRLLEEEKENELWAAGDVPGLNSKLWRERWRLANPDWNFDVIPEIIDGKTIFDFVDPDIEERLEELEREESARVQELEEEEAMKSSESDLDVETMDMVHKIRNKRALLNLQNRTKTDVFDVDEVSKGDRIPSKYQTRNLDKLETHLTSMGLTEEESATAVDKVRSRSRSQSRVGRKRDRSVSRSGTRSEEDNLTDKKKLKRSISRTRSVSMTPKPGSGYKDVRDVQKAVSAGKRIQMGRAREAKKGESDRHIPNLMPKHLYTGKRGIGKTDRR